MKKYKCIIVDDEPIAIRVIKNHLSHFSEFEIVAECSNAIEAMKVLREHSIDLLFLDIEMPALTGLEMLKTQTISSQFIFTTAHRNYAIEAFEVKALDYLLKPISLERFTKALNRFFDLKSNTNSAIAAPINDHVFLKVEKKNCKVYFNDILYVESMSDYIIIYLSGKKLVVKERISHMEKKLPNTTFLRVHRAYIVNTQKIEASYGNIIEIAGLKIPIGRNYKENVNQLFAKTP